MKTLKLLAAAAVCVSFSSFLSADTGADKDYFSVKTEAVTLTAMEAGKDARPAEPEGFAALKTNKAAGGGIVNAGMAAWNVINSGAPSGSYSSAYASAIPGFSFNWGNIAEWKGPKEMVYRYKVTNLMGIDVIDVKYKISFFYGGTEDYSGKEAGRLDNYVAQATGGANGGETRDGKVHGRYITNFTVQPVSVNVKWGWKFDLAVKMSDPMNIGTKMNPVTALQASLHWIRSTPFATNGGTLTYNVDGLGNFKDMTQVEKDMTGEIAPVQISETPTVAW